MFTAVVYNSCTGSCKKYAELIAEQLGINAVEFGKAKGLGDGKVVYVGWLFAGKIMGLDKAFDMYDIGAVCQVGMGAVNEESEKIGREKNGMKPEMPLFCLQGGFDLKKLPLHYRLMMTLMNKNIAKRLNEKGELNEQEKATLKMAETGCGEPASWCVDDVVAWCKEH